MYIYREVILKSLGTRTNFSSFEKGRIGEFFSHRHNIVLNTLRVSRMEFNFFLLQRNYDGKTDQGSKTNMNNYHTTRYSLIPN